MSETIKKNLNTITIAVIGVLIVGQDIYIFSQIGPAIDLLHGPEGIKAAQEFSNMRNLTTTMITHGLLVAIIALILLQQSRPINLTTTTKDDITK